SKSVTINQPSAINLNSASQTNVSCNGGSNGSASVTPSGGMTPYSYSWSPSGGTGATASGLAAGTYKVTVTDANGCIATRSFTVAQPSAINVSGIKTDASCGSAADGQIALTVGGGVPGYTYSWSPSGR